MDQEIGRRLKDIRTREGMSQRQLARVSGVANATISQIEAGRLNPTVSMLKKVLDGFPISMSEFFADHFEAVDRIFYRTDELTEIADGGVSFRQVGANLNNKSIQLIKECYQAGAGDAYYFRSNQPHHFRNPGNEPCELISACTPPSF